MSNGHRNADMAKCACVAGLVVTDFMKGMHWHRAAASNNESENQCKK